MAEAAEATSVLEDEEAARELTDGQGRINAKGVNEVTQTRKMSSQDEEAALNFFLSDDNDVEETFRLFVPRTDIWFTFRPIREAELKALQKRAATGKRLPNGNREVDLLRLYRLILIDCMVSPKLKTQEILERFGQPEAALEKKLRPGEIENLAEKVMRQSGFDDDSVIDEDMYDEAMLAKN